MKRSWDLSPGFKGKLNQKQHKTPRTGRKEEAVFSKEEHEARDSKEGNFAEDVVG